MAVKKLVGKNAVKTATARAKQVAKRSAKPVVALPPKQQADEIVAQAAQSSCGSGK